MRAAILHCRRYTRTPPPSSSSSSSPPLPSSSPPAAVAAACPWLAVAERCAVHRRSPLTRHTGVRAGPSRSPPTVVVRRARPPGAAAQPLQRRQLATVAGPPAGADGSIDDSSELGLQEIQSAAREARLAALARAGLVTRGTGSSGTTPAAAAANAAEALPAEMLDYGYPSVDSAVREPLRRFSETPSTSLQILASQGVTGAHKERLLREIMRVDRCSYADAYVVLASMNRQNAKLQWVFKTPYLVGMSCTLVTGLGAIPAVFHRGTAVWFCQNFVGDEIPDLGTLQTCWQVGAWTWTWMEPAIGTFSFVLLSLQLIRSQMQKMQWKPYIGLVKSIMADRLAIAFPQYEREMVRDYAKADPWGRDSNRMRRGFPANSIVPVDH
jgi:hypothetical protein